MLFSVVIPTFNRAHLLADTLESVFNQTFTDYEVIVVDDGSTDSTQQYLGSLDARIIFLTQSNHGPGAARNLGARHAQAEYLVFLDSDDVWFPWILWCFAEVIKLHGRPAILGASFM